VSLLMLFESFKTGFRRLARLGHAPRTLSASGIVAVAWLAGCVDLTPPWEHAANRDTGAPLGSGGGFILADANAAGGSSGNGGPIEGWPVMDVPAAGTTDGAAFGEEGGLADVCDGAPVAVDVPNADTGAGLPEPETGRADDVPLEGNDSERTDVQWDVPSIGTGGVGGSFLDASSGGATGGEDVGGAMNEVRGTDGAESADGWDGGAGGIYGAGGAGAGGSTGSGGDSAGGGGAGGTGTGGGATGGSGAGGSGSGGSGAGGTGAGGSETGGTGSGGSETGGSGSGGSGAGGTGAGGTGTGGGTGGGAGSACVGYQGADAGSGIDESQIVYYRCESAAGASGTLLQDSSGHAYDGTLHTGTGGNAGYSFAAGKVHNALTLVAAQQGYVTLPVGLLAHACEATIATWFWINSSQNWQRIFDFGSDTNVYMFLTPKTNVTGKLRFAISIGGNTAEQTIDGTEELSTGTWYHVAVVLGPSGGALYVNGSRVASNTGLTLRPADLGNPDKLFIGRSQFAADPYFDGRIDSFRIYDRALSDAEINQVYLYDGT
jgi:hypothetical protein